jgi:predicted acetyltransferase
VRRAVEAGGHWEMAEIYVKPEFRRRGLAFKCAADIFEKHRGQWRISFNKHNRASRNLWTKLAHGLAFADIETGEADVSHDYIRFSV